MATTSSVIGSTTYALSGDTEIVISRSFDAPRRLVFDAFTNPEHLPNWLLGPDGWTMTICEIDLRPGGQWRFGWRHTDGSDMTMNGVYQAITRPELVVNTENWGGPYPQTLNTLTLTEADGATAMRNVVRYPSAQARENALSTGMREGSSISYDRLAGYLATLA
jgi:uncharacterized protein YndB with AHSA1/START domain